MSTINLYVECNGLTWSIPIERRITVVRGDSGTGKTTMTNYISAASQQMGKNIIVKCALNIKVANWDSWQSVIKDEKFTKTLFIFDDVSDVRTLAFAQEMQKSADRGNYFLIIAREDLKLGDYSNISLAVSSILRFVTSRNGKRHYTKPYFNMHKHIVNKVRCTDVLVEDTAGGRQFFDRLFGEKYVHSAKHGKSSISDDAVNILSDASVSLLVLADMSAFGCHMYEFEDKVLSEYKDRVYIDSKYECFEELLLRTNYFKNNSIVQTQFSSIETYANEFLSWETYFEKLLEDLTKGTNGVQYSHGGNIRTCWVQDCNSCNMGKHTNCAKLALNTNKIDWLLKDTKYEKLLILRDNMKKIRKIKKTP
jgi:hypothetical protein